MTRILSILAVLSILFFPSISYAACQKVKDLRFRLLAMGYVPAFQMVIADKVSQIYINRHSEFIQFKIEHDGTVCQLFSGRRVEYFPERKS